MPFPSEDKASRHYFDSTFRCNAVKILPNEYYVAGDDIMLSTVLGSCVAACVNDPVAGIGGMNHFMLPDGDTTSPASSTMRYGAYAMEMLINEILKAGGVRERLQAKVFGGGAVLSAMQYMNIGERNAEFVLRYLKLEGIPVVGQDLRADYARRIHYFPKSGKALMRKMASSQRADAVAAREQAVVQSMRDTKPAKPRVERFDTAPSRPASGTASWFTAPSR
ncbi:chemoreceptor glutamine deamidase CheD [Schauerella aestuarii]|uniref:chemoreceptor glutamine deamidase CheD n=1 Tax=Schauerella aestuarii TaxID=2511204 RepID=UPI00136E886C|nr:chemoreceptor glutamine deamidase CheD [Achromobacter aestuarii]MYZ44273.1 chemoreceptor glutamine deamidase CheD [Achromobacter aestuarii]